MLDPAFLTEWLAFAVRWLHVITAIAWIGSSFYFVALDLGLRKAPDLPPGAYGEEWQVHGGGFYHIRKYLVAPEAMPEHLTWFKWESYATWLSGAALLAIIYWLGAELYLIDPEKADLAVWQGILISAGSLTIGWLVYDYLCKSGLGEKPTVLMLLLFVLLVVMAWGYDQIFTGRAALLHLGAFTATIMTANVFFVIMPNQRIVVDDLKERPHAGSEIRQDRQVALDPQQLPHAAGAVPDAVEPLPAGFCHRVQLAHRVTGLPDGRDDPALLQHDACPEGQPSLDLGGHRGALRRDHVAVARADVRPARRRGRGPAAHPDRAEIRGGRGFRGSP